MDQGPLRKLCFEAKKGRWSKQQVRDFVNTRGVDPNAMYTNKKGEQRTPLAFAVEFNNDAFARHLLELEPEAADPNLRMPPTEECPAGDTPLTLAVKNEQFDGTEMVRVLLARGADQAQLAEVEPLLNKTMQYWRLRAQERRPFQQRMLKAFKLEGLREVEFAVVGEQAATTAISNQIMHFVGQHAAHEGKPLVIFIPGAPGHGKTYFTKNLAKALVGEENFLFVAGGSIKSARELFGVQWGSTSDDGRITSFLKARQDTFSVVMLDEFEKPQSLVNEGGWDQSKPIYQSFLEPWQEGTIQNAGRDQAQGGANASASDRGRTIRCSKCIFICTTNLCQQEIVDFAKLPAHQRRMSERMGEQDIQWIDRELVQPTIKPNLMTFFRRINPELQALVRRIDLIVPFVPLAREEQVVVGDMELRSFFADYRKPPLWEPKPGEQPRMAGNLVVRHTEDVAELTADEYSVMEGASSMKKAANKFCIPITIGYAEHEWKHAPQVMGVVSGGDGSSVPLNKIWLHVPDDESKNVVVATEKPKPKPRRAAPSPASGPPGGEHGPKAADDATPEPEPEAQAGGAAAAGGAGANDEVDEDF